MVLTRLSNSAGPNTVILVGPDSLFLRNTLLQLNEIDLWTISELSPSPERISAAAEALEAQMASHNLKRITFLASSWGAPIVIQYAASFARNVRRVVLIDGRSRFERSLMEKAAEFLDQILPLGLPLRPLSKAFDPRPILHRLRCPTLILQSEGLEDEAAFLGERIPNSWIENFSERSFGERFRLFLDVPTKQPQKKFRKITTNVL